jgi:hypothetical protein
MFSQWGPTGCSYGKKRHLVKTGGCELGARAVSGRFRASMSQARDTRFPSGKIALQPGLGADTHPPGPSRLRDLHRWLRPTARLPRPRKSTTLLRNRLGCRLPRDERSGPGRPRGARCVGIGGRGEALRKNTSRHRLHGVACAMPRTTVSPLSCAATTVSPHVRGRSPDRTSASTPPPRCTQEHGCSSPNPGLFLSDRRGAQ